MSRKTNGLPKAERHARIERGLQLNSALRVSELAQSLGVTTETIRRDLDEMGRNGLLNRTYGGAAAPFQFEPSVSERESTMIEERARIGMAAADLVSSDDVIMIDSGSTTLQLARLLAARSDALTVITNGLSIATALGVNPGIRIFVLPGTYQAREAGVFGEATVESISNLRANVGFIGASGVAADGITEAVSESAWVKRAMLKKVQRTVLLADHTKSGRIHLEHICPWSAIDDLVTDKQPDNELSAALAAGAVTTHIAPRHRLTNRDAGKQGSPGRDVAG